MINIPVKLYAWNAYTMTTLMANLFGPIQLWRKPIGGQVGNNGFARILGGIPYNTVWL